MRAERGEVALLDLHLARLASGAETLGYALDLDEVARGVRRAAAYGEPARVRLVLWRDGAHEITVSPLAEAPFRTAAIYPEPIEEAGTWRCTLKTTARAHYDRALAWAAARGVDEPILLNPRGEVMEGARTNVFVRRGGQLLTPPLAAGGLGGVMRQRLLAEGAEERPLAPEDLLAADAVAARQRGPGRDAREHRSRPAREQAPFPDIPLSNEQRHPRPPRPEPRRPEHGPARQRHRR